MQGPVFSCRPGLNPFLRGEYRPRYGILFLMNDRVQSTLPRVISGVPTSAEDVRLGGALFPETNQIV